MKVNNVMQLCEYDCAAKTHTQITFGPENKHSPSWSPDGTHLMFSKEQGNKNQIVALNRATKKIHPLTALQDNCSYPHWSSVYKIFPSL